MISTTDEVRHWLFDHALPLWAQAGLDPVHGGFAERLDFAAKPLLSENKRLRVQARQIYVYAQAHLLGWNGPAREAAMAGLEFLTRHGWHPEKGGWQHLLAPDGSAVDEKRDTYDHAFVLYALAWHYRAFGDSDALDWIDRTLEFLDSHLTHRRHGGYQEAVPPALPRRQNPHMHLFEAFLALFEATGDRGHLDRADAILALFDRHFRDGPDGALREYFTDDWQPAPDGGGDVAEPGHHFEWTWLLHRHGALSGTDNGARAASLYGFAAAHGVDARDGLAWDEISVTGTPLRTTKRLWVQTEAVKAHLARHEVAGASTLAQADHVMRQILSRYLATDVPGLWQDHLDADGHGFAGAVPASSFYHLILAMAEFLRVTAHSSTA